MHFPESDYQKLSVKQRQAIDLIATGKNDTEVAGIIGVGRDTVCRWRNHNPDFKRVLEVQLDLLTIRTRVGGSDNALQVYELLKKYLPPVCFRMVIDWLKLENVFVLK